MSSCLPEEKDEIGDYPPPSAYCHQATLTTTADDATEDYEFSGGDYRSSTCSHFVVNDAKWLKEYRISIDTSASRIIMEELAEYRLRGFGGDYEGVCVFHQGNGATKLAVIDEGNRTAALCDIDTAGNTIDLEDPTECVSYSLEADVLNNPVLMDPDINRGFEGVACNAEDQKLYIAQEKNPMAIWQLDLVTGTFDVLIAVEKLAPWTDLVEDLAGVRIYIYI
jgi:myo-inositol-hexaphosphate 3-phosphohydrolase